MYLSLIINCLSALLFSDSSLKPENALIFHGRCRPAISYKLPENHFVQVAQKKKDAPEIELIASSGVVFLPENNTFLFEKNSNARQPIASLTKLMTALVFLDNNPGFEEEYVIKAGDNVVGGRNHLFTGERIKIKDLWSTSLIASDNSATLALARATGLSDERFVLAMNEKAKRLGLFNTSFSEPTGLSDLNVSTARDVARLAKEALSKKEISDTTSLLEYNFNTAGGRLKKIESTDYLLGENDDVVKIIGGKTGYTENAGYCFVGRFMNQDKKELISVILNSDDKHDRFTETKSLVTWVFNNFTWD